MSYCTQCGAYIPTGETKCPACGFDPAAQQQSAWGGGAAAAQQQSQQQNQQQQQSQQQSTPEEDKSSQSVTAPWEPWKQEAKSGGGTDPRRLSVLSYVGPLFLLPLLLHKEDPFVRYHANQGLVLFLLECLLYFLTGGILALAGMIFCVYCLVRGAKNVAEGKMAPLPLIGGLKLIK